MHAYPARLEDLVDVELPHIFQEHPTVRLLLETTPVIQNYRPVQSIDRMPGRRGFTLIELMVVVVIITALAALAVPSIIRQMRDRRVRQAAEEIALIYRQARLRALGRGSAVMVRYTVAAGFETREAVVGGGGNCASLPSPNCLTTLWGQGPNIANGSQQIGLFNAIQGAYQGVVVNVIPTGTGSTNGELDICYTPMGRSFSATPSATPLQTMTGVPLITVAGNTGGLTRQVLVPPNGLARTGVSK
jgi:type IV fimbrial biogenesis protein FimT